MGSKGQGGGPRRPAGAPPRPAFGEVTQEFMLRGQRARQTQHAAGRAGETTQMIMLRAGIDRAGKARSRLRAGILVLVFAAAAAGVVVGSATLVQTVEWKIPVSPGRVAPKKVAAQPAVEIRASHASPAPSAAPAPAPALAPAAGSTEAVRSAAPLTSGERKNLDLLSAKQDAKPLAVPVAEAAALPPALSDAQVKRTITRSNHAFQSCISSAMRRREFRSGRMVLTVTVAPSGSVTRAVIDRPGVDRSDLGACLKSACRRMIFPKFQGSPFEVEIPLVIASGG